MKIRSLALAILTCTLGSAAFAQTAAHSIGPTTGGGNDALSKGLGEGAASVQQLITLRLPKATALHLDVTSLLFDLTALDGPDWAARAAGKVGGVDFGGQMVCVYGLQNTDVVTPLGEDFYNQKQILPLGTSYNLSAASWPNISVNGGGVVNTYPPIRIGADACDIVDNLTRSDEKAFIFGVDAELVQPEIVDQRRFGVRDGIADHFRID